MKFDHPTYGKFGVINIFALTGEEEAVERISLWQELVTEFNNEIPWILTGDFNMIEHLTDQEGRNGPADYKAHMSCAPAYRIW